MDQPPFDQDGRSTPGRLQNKDRGVFAGRRSRGRSVGSSILLVRPRRGSWSNPRRTPGLALNLPLKRLPRGSNEETGPGRSMISPAFVRNPSTKRRDDSRQETGKRFPARKYRLTRLARCVKFLGGFFQSFLPKARQSACFSAVFSAAFGRATPCNITT